MFLQEVVTSEVKERNTVHADLGTIGVLVGYVGRCARKHFNLARVDERKELVLLDRVGQVGVCHEGVHTSYHWSWVQDHVE